MCMARNINQALQSRQMNIKSLSEHTATIQDSREEIYHSLELNLNTVYNKPIQEGLSGGFLCLRFGVLMWVGLLLEVYGM